jgi:hypothetical protein
VEHASADYEYACARQNDVLNKTFEPAEVNRFKTHTQGHCRAPTFYKTCEKRVQAHSKSNCNARRIQMKDFSVADFAAIVSIDWADKKHDICELPAGTKDYQWSVISSKPDQLLCDKPLSNGLV